ncbi:hypothetical protein MSL71_42160 [Desulfoluna butyratoxydans]|uniref:Uncharacterized protein n=1 Tax=Desulfoluna butyratoxydans TaxID=231438 RepID=A0A4U8YT60_9BACT|nr:hypothetical protein MSL71_42160 [Desulfoluna butyratoxydans]
MAPYCLLRHRFTAPRNAIRCGSRTLQLAMLLGVPQDAPCAPQTPHPQKPTDVMAPLVFGATDLMPLETPSGAGAAPYSSRCRSVFRRVRRAYRKRPIHRNRPKSWRPIVFCVTDLLPLETPPGAGAAPYSPRYRSVSRRCAVRTANAPSIETDRSHGALCFFASPIYCPSKRHLVREPHPTARDAARCPVGCAVRTANAPSIPLCQGSCRLV